MPDVADLPKEPTLSAAPELPLLPDLCQDPAPAAIEWPMDADKISINVFHYNIQYVAGGLDNYFDTWTATEEEIEDLIIVESFEPLVDLFERHPTWGASFEMQGLMLEIMAARHPDILKRFGDLVRRGQVDVMSFHWSDQLVTAYPRQHMEWSWLENQRVFDGLCLKRSPGHFLQEGQFGPGIAQFAAERGETVIMPRNLVSVFHDPRPNGWHYNHMGSRVLMSDGHSGEGLTLNWNYVDDAELVATGDANPYLLSEFKHDPEFLANTYEKSLQALDDSGYAITPVSHYLKVIDDRELPKTPVDPPVLDGSWQPRDSSNMALWMGGKGQSPGDERDNLILTTNIVAGQRLRNVEYLLKRATDEGIDTSEAQKVFRFAMRELLLATVSDSTGWRPLITEVQYSVRHQQEALKRAAELATWLLYKLGEARPAHVDGRNKTVSAPPSVAVDGTTVAAPIEVTVTAERPVELSWLQHEGYKTLTVTVPATDETTVAAENPPEIRISIPLEHDVIAYTPALLDDQVLSRPLSSAAFASNDEQRLGLALPNGLLGLGPSRSLVLDQKTVHLAALIEPGAVVFEELTQPAQDAAVWVFRLYDAPAEDTLDAANSLNVYPPSVFE